jgi:hypothetical protein
MSCTCGTIKGIGVVMKMDAWKNCIALHCMKMNALNFHSVTRKHHTLPHFQPTMRIVRNVVEHQRAGS